MSKIYDVPNNVLVHQFLAAKARTSETSAVLDRLAAGKKISGRSLLVLDIGTYTGGTPVVKLQESSATPAGGFTDVTGGAFAAKTSTGFWALAVDLEKTERYLRVVQTGEAAGTTNAVHLMAPASEEAPITNPTA